MLKMGWAKVDKFYIALVIVLAVMAAVVIFAFKGVFSAYITAYEIDQRSLDVELSVNKEKLNEAHKWVFEREIIPLQMEF